MTEYIPEGRGEPRDIEETGANCGPCAFAAYLNLSAAKAIEFLPHWKEKGVVPIKPMLAGLEEYGIPHKSIKLQEKERYPSFAFEKNLEGLAFIQFTGKKNPEKYSGWRCWSQEYLYTHWIAYDRGRVYDNCVFNNDNNKPGVWVPEIFWIYEVAPFLVPKEGLSYYIRNILIPKNSQAIPKHIKSP